MLTEKQKLLKVKRLYEAQLKKYQEEKKLNEDIESDSKTLTLSSHQIGFIVRLLRFYMNLGHNKEGSIEAKRLLEIITKQFQGN